MISTPRAGIEMSTQSADGVLKGQGRPRSFRSPERGDPSSSREATLEEQSGGGSDGIVVSRHFLETVVAWTVVGGLLAAGGFGFQ